MTFDPTTILNARNITVERTPGELSHWVTEIIETLASYPEAKEFVLLRKGIAKKFFEEVRPLSLLADKLYGGRRDIVCVPNLDNFEKDNFDAIIRNYSFSPPQEKKIEFTMAIDGYDEHLRMRYFLECGHVCLTGPVRHSGNKSTGDKKINVLFEFVNRGESLNKKYQLVKQRIEDKLLSNKYGHNYILVVIIDDYLAPRYDSEKDWSAFRNFLEHNISYKPGEDFEKIYILGESGKTFLPV